MSGNSSLHCLALPITSCSEIDRVGKEMQVQKAQSEASLGRQGLNAVYVGRCISVKTNHGLVAFCVLFFSQ